MTVRGGSQRGDAQLRVEAEARLAAKRAQRASAKERPVEELLHELQVHQIELEMQNETLRQSQIALEASRDRYIDFYDFAPVGYLTLTEKGLIAEINLGGAEMLGTDRTGLLQRRFSPHVAAEDIVRWQRHFTEALRSDASLNCEIALVRPNGSQIDVRFDSRRMVGEGHVPSVRSVLTDITERKRVQDALSASVEFSNRLIESMQDGLSLVDVDGVHLDVNPALCMMTGFSREELLGTGLPHAYWPPEAHEAILASFRKVREDQAKTLELTFMRKNGERFPVIVSPSTVKDRQGNTLGYMATVKDITKRKQAEEALREMAADLEEMVDQRTKELRRLSAQLTMTEERERRMLAEDLHDNLGQLLAVIKIKLTTLAGGSLSSAVKDVVALVDQAERSARSITMELSPPILHRLGLMPALDWLCDEMERVYGIAVQIRGDNCDMRLGPEIQAVLYRSVRELLINVAKHAKVSDANVTCLCEPGRLTIQVEDEGCGFDPVDHGLGLFGQRSFGISSIYERMINLGGAMEVDSSPGHGTTVTLTVPCATDS